MVNNIPAKPRRKNSLNFDRTEPVMAIFHGGIRETDYGNFSYLLTRFSGVSLAETHGGKLGKWLLSMVIPQVYGRYQSLPCRNFKDTLKGLRWCNHSQLETKDGNGEVTRGFYSPGCLTRILKHLQTTLSLCCINRGKRSP
ncbi:hypothetical protein KQX54_006121 [Cotesia glomerata]|uniref:Uncharacterized protein n=1 Tax=Cotesia glomerata TaxID=32391 RepID=A0AAV7I7C5_COTGL|nr:hypothetical protein KQX54_006121 [Cotesia glomerata]